MSNDAQMERIKRKLVDQLQFLAKEAIQFKKLIDEAKTDLKKDFYKKKLEKNSKKAEKVIIAMTMLQKQEVSEQTQGGDEHVGLL